MNEDVVKEIWKQYPEISWIEVSSWGRVRTLDRVVLSGRGRRPRLIKGKILKQYLAKNGYLFVGFRVNGKSVRRSVHRLVAQTFLPNPNGLPDVNHKDCDRANNNVDNLEWCNASYNGLYREKYGVSNGRPVFAINVYSLEVTRFKSQKEASRSLKVDSSTIAKVAKGKLKQAGSYWFTNADSNAIEAARDRFDDIVDDKLRNRPLFAINLTTSEVLRFRSQIEASRMLGVGQQCISRVIRGERKQTGGYWFVEATPKKLGDEVVDKVEDLMNDKELQTA